MITQAYVHDLIKLNSTDKDFFDLPLPAWALESLNAMPYVVVRRGRFMQIQRNSYIPVGIRGVSREKRFATFLSLENCEKVITPQQIVDEKMWINSHDSKWSKLLKQMNKRLLKWDHRLEWGPTGSVGFEIVTTHEATTKQSDLDLIIKPKLPLSVEEARQLLSELQEECVILNHTCIDISMQTGKGWIALPEYANGSGTYLIKTENGEDLVKDIW